MSLQPPAASVDLILTEADFQSLGSVASGQRSPLSPFANRSDRPPTADRLRELGVATDDRGALTGDAGDAIGLLNSCSAFAGLAYGGASSYELTAYFGGNGVVSLANTKDGLRLSSPPLTDRIVALLRQHLGDSALRSVEFDETLAIADAMVLAAAIDVTRRRSLAILAGGSPQTAPIFTADVAERRSPGRDDESLSSALIRSLPGHPGVGDVAGSLAVLRERGLVRPGQNDAIDVTDRTSLLATRLVAITAYLRVSAGRVTPDGKIATVAFNAVQSGPLDILLWFVAEPGQVRLRTASASELAKIAERLLTDPAALRTGDPAAVVS